MSLSDVWERFKLLLHKCSNHNMSSMDQLKHFMRGLTISTRIIIDALARGTMREKTDQDVKTLIENMCRNEYCSSELAIKGKGMLAVETQKALLAQTKAFTK